MNTRILVFAAGLLASTPLCAEIYKCTDAAGRIDYSDKPCPGASEIFTPRTGPKTDTDRNARKVKTRQLLRAFEEEAARKQQATAERKAEQVKQAENCRRAQQRLALANSTGRLFMRQPDGGRSYLSDAEREEAIAAERVAVAHWCK